MTVRRIVGFHWTLRGGAAYTFPARGSKQPKSAGRYSDSAMSLIRLENVTKTFGGKPTLDGISFRVEEGEKIGLIGRNGTGKSTIFRLITGELEPDSGTIERMRRARIACLAQMPDLGMSDTIFDTAMMPFRELVEMEKVLADLEHRMAAGDESVHDRYGALQDMFSARGGYTFHTTAKRVLHGLGFREADYNLPVNALSGGQRTRLMLALILLQDADLLLLDEPENHLDIEAQEWLETFLLESPKAIVIITHDRRMLDHVVTRIVEVERGALANYSGNYAFYRKQKALVREQQQKAFERQQAFIEKEQSWIERFRYKNTKADQVQSRIARLEKMERLEAPPPESASVKFTFGDVVRSGQWVLKAEGLAMAYGDLRLYQGLSFHVERGERVGIIGPNGSGKTTLLRHLAGRLPIGTGTVTLGHKVRIGFYQQHHEDVNRANDILAEIRALRPDLTPERVRNYMGRYLFTGDDIFKPLSALSGGELSRVAIAKLVLGGANLLLLDEPTNHLDIASRETIEGALEEFPGTILLVSHDRQLIDRLVNRLIVVENGTASVYLGNYSDYHRKTEQENAVAAPQPKHARDPMSIRKKPSGKDKSAERESRKRRKQLDEIERNIEAMEEMIEAFDQRFASLDPSDYMAARRLKEEYDGLKEDLQALYAEWEQHIAAETG